MIDSAKTTAASGTFVFIVKQPSLSSLTTARYLQSLFLTNDRLRVSQNGSYVHQYNGGITGYSRVFRWAAPGRISKAPGNLKFLLFNHHNIYFHATATIRQELEKKGILRQSCTG